MSRSPVLRAAALCLRCHMAPDACDCFDYLAETGFPASIVRGAVVRLERCEAGFAVTVEIARGASAADLKRALPVIVEWQRAVQCRGRQPASSTDAFLERTAARHDEGETFPELVKRLYGRVAGHLRDYERDRGIDAGIAARRVTTAEEREHALRAIDVRLHGGECVKAWQVYDHGLGWRRAVDLLQLLGMTPARAAAEAKRLVELAADRLPLLPEDPVELASALKERVRTWRESKRRREWKRAAARADQPSPVRR